MILFPAIDLKDGECVRLVHGEMGSATVFNPDPAAQAASFERQGFEFLHLVDLDGAMKGLNLAGTVALAEAVHLPVIASGGLASLDDVARLLEPDCAVLAGAVTGRALYDGRLDPAAALAMIRAARDRSVSS